MKEINGVSVYSTVEEIIHPSHTALLVVDVQNDFSSPDGHFARNGKDVSQIVAVLPRIVKVIALARAAGVPVFYTLQTTLPDAGSDPPGWLYFKTRDGKSPNYTLDGSWGQALDPALSPLPDEPQIKKPRPSAFLHTNLDLLLRSRRIETLVLCGCLTQGCVQATAIDGSSHDYYIVVAEDAVQSTNQDLHHNALKFLGSRFDMVTAERLAGLWGKPATLGAGQAIGGV